MEDSQRNEQRNEWSAGARLRRGRIHLGLSEAQMAERLHVDEKVIVALEAERFTALGAPVFVRGHLRRYAETVGLDADAITREVESRETPAALPDLTQVPRALPQPDPRRFLWPAVITAGIAVLASILWWALNSPAAH